MNKIDYKETIEELIKIEETFKEKVKFQETYLNQLKRRLKIYEKGRLDALKDELDFLEQRKKEYGNNTNFMFSSFGERLTQIKKEINQIEEENLNKNGK